MPGEVRHNKFHSAASSTSSTYHSRCYRVMSFSTSSVHEQLSCHVCQSISGVVGTKQRSHWCCTKKQTNQLWMTAATCVWVWPRPKALKHTAHIVLQKKRANKPSWLTHPTVRSLIGRIGAQWKDHCSMSDRAYSCRKRLLLLSAWELGPLTSNT